MKQPSSHPWKTGYIKSNRVLAIDTQNILLQFFERVVGISATARIIQAKRTSDELIRLFEANK